MEFSSANYSITRPLILIFVDIGNVILEVPPKLIITKLSQLSSLNYNFIRNINGNLLLGLIEALCNCRGIKNLGAKCGEKRKKVYILQLNQWLKP